MEKLKLMAWPPVTRAEADRARAVDRKVKVKQAASALHLCAGITGKILNDLAAQTCRYALSIKL